MAVFLYKMAEFRKNPVHSAQSEQGEALPAPSGAVHQYVVNSTIQMSIGGDMGNYRVYMYYYPLVHDPADFVKVPYH